MVEMLSKEVAVFMDTAHDGGANAVEELREIYEKEPLIDRKHDFLKL